MTRNAKFQDRAAIERKLERTEANIKRLTRLAWDLRRELERARLRELVGQDNAVRLRFRRSDRWSVLNDLFGTITEVRRTRASVDFGTPHGVVRIALDALRPASELQGLVIA